MLHKEKMCHFRRYTEMKSFLKRVPTIMDEQHWKWWRIRLKMSIQMSCWGTCRDRGRLIKLSWTLSVNIFSTCSIHMRWSAKYVEICSNVSILAGCLLLVTVNIWFLKDTASAVRLHSMLFRSDSFLPPSGKWFPFQLPKFKRDAASNRPWTNNCYVLHWQLLNWMGKPNEFARDLTLLAA